MSVAYVIRPRADRDLEGIAEYLVDAANLETGLRFLVEVHEAFARIATQPEMGWRCRVAHPQLKTARTFRVSARFEDYLVFYQPYRDRIACASRLAGLGRPVWPGGSGLKVWAERSGSSGDPDARTFTFSRADVV